jgi:hypothetical protein
MIRMIIISREQDRKRERNDKEVRKAFCSMKSFTGLTKCKRKKWVSLLLSLSGQKRFASFAAAYNH